MSTEKTSPSKIPFLDLLKIPSDDPLTYFLQLTHYGDIVQMPGAQNRFLVNNPSAIQKVLQTNFNNYTKVGTNYERLQIALGYGLLTNSGELWAQRRHDLQPMLYYKNLARFTDYINTTIETELNAWEKTVFPYFNLANACLVLVAKISAAVLFGIDITKQAQLAVNLVHTSNSFVAKSLSVSRWFPSLGNLRFRIAQKKLNYLLLNAIAHQRIPQIGEPLMHSVISDYEQQKISTDELLGEVKNFFIAGHETTGNAIAWTIYCLLQNPSVLEKLLKEIFSVTNNRPVTFVNLTELQYEEMVLDEAMRLYPPIWIIERCALADDELENYKIPKNSIVVISPYTIQRDPRYWQDPEKFFPERFLPQHSKNRPKHAFIPFGAGPRTCIGKLLAMMFSKMILTRVLQRFEIKLAQQDVKTEALVTLRPKRGLWVTMKSKNL